MDQRPDFVDEPARRTSVVEEADVVVCGAGPAGVCAAIQAARAGARTRLLELNGCLGGVWTAGLLSYVLDADKPGGLLAEIVARLQEREAYRPRVLHDFTYDPEQMKLVLEGLCRQADVRVQLHTRIVDASVDEGGRLRAVITESKSGRQAWRGKVFIDCTGDGDLAARAGCGYWLGRGEAGETQPMSLLALVTGVDPEAARPFHDGKVTDRKDALRREIERGGHTPSYSSPGLFHIKDDLFALMANHHYLIRPDDAQRISDATMTGRREIDQAVRALRALGGTWRRLRVVATAEQIGVREGRRIHGWETVVAEDLAAGRRHEQSVCRASFGMDVHSPNPAVSKDYDRTGRLPVLPYDIPYGALVARDVQGLLLAGRCISGDFLAHASYRVTGNAAVLGESAGLAAARCVREHRLPHELITSVVM